MKRCVLAIAVLASALLTGCGGSDEPAPDRVRPSLLQPSDLPGPAEYSYPAQPGAGGVRVEISWGCYGRVFNVLGDSGYIQDRVGYDLGDRGRVYAFRYTNKVRDAAADLTDMATQWRACNKLGYNVPVPVTAGPEATVTEVDHGPNAFGFRTSSEGDVYGETVLTVVDGAIVQVTVLGRDHRPTTVDVKSLLAAAVKRAS